MTSCQEQRVMKIKLGKLAWILSKRGRQNNFNKSGIYLIFKTPFNATATQSNKNSSSDHLLIFI